MKNFLEASLREARGPRTQAETARILGISQMGHRETAIFFRHYRALAHPGDGARYFSILP